MKSVKKPSVNWITKFISYDSCFRDCNQPGTFLCIWRTCPKVHQFWIKIYKFIYNLTHIFLSKTASVVISNHPFPNTPRNPRILICYVFLVATITIGRSWKLLSIIMRLEDLPMRPIPLSSSVFCSSLQYHALVNLLSHTTLHTLMCSIMFFHFCFSYSLLCHPSSCMGVWVEQQALESSFLQGTKGSSVLNCAHNFHITWLYSFFMIFKITMYYFIDFNKNPWNGKPLVD